MHHKEHAEEAGHHRHHAMPADPFVEKRPSKGCDYERREKELGDGLIKLKVSQRDEVEAGGYDHQPGAEPLHQRLGRAKRGASAKGHSTAVLNATCPANLSHVTSTTGIPFLTTRNFAVESSVAKQSVASANQPNGLQSSARMDVGEGEPAGSHEAGPCRMNLCQNAISR